jgi:hypothetical protein
VHEAVVHLESGSVDGGRLDLGCALIPENGESQVGVEIRIVGGASSSGRGANPIYLFWL